MAALMNDLMDMPSIYERFLLVDVYNELKDKGFVKNECSPFEFYGAVSPQMLIQEGYSEYVVYLFSYILKAGWIEYHNIVARQEGREEFHFCYEKCSKALLTEKFMSWIRRKEKARQKNLASRLKRVLVLDKFPENDLDLLIVEDVFAIPPDELYKCNGIGRESILKLRDHFMAEGLDWFHFHQFKPKRKDFIDVGRGW